MPPIDQQDSAVTEPVATAPVVDPTAKTVPVVDLTAKTDSGDLVLPESNENPPGSVAPPGYWGRPVIPGLTSITLRPRVSVLSGPVPLPVHVTMLECTWTGPSGGNPYEDLEFSINFGDASGTQRFTNPTNETEVNPNSDQVGPEAFYVYQTPGVYTITVTARGWNGTQFVTATSSTLVQGASIAARGYGATRGTYTLRVQNGHHARSAKWIRSNLALVRPAGHAIVPSSSGFMFSGWFMVGNTVSSKMTIAGVYSDAPAAGAGKSWMLWYTGASQQLTLNVGVPGTSTPASVTSTETNLGVGWHHVVAWCDTAGTVGMIIDGGMPNTNSRPPGPMTVPSTVPFALAGYIGASNTVSQSFTGSMDEVAFWNRPPAPGEIAWLYNNGVGRHYGDLAASSPPTSLAAGLVAWWTLDEPFGPSWDDATGNGHTLEEGLVLASGTKPAIGVSGDVPRVYRPGGVQTSPLPYNAAAAEIASAVAAAIGVQSPGDVYRDGNYAIRFGGVTSGQPWTLAPGTTADGFDGQVVALGESGAATATAISATAWPVANYPEVYFDSNAPDGGTGTALSPYNAVATLRTVLGDFGGKRVRIAAGSDFLLDTVTTSAMEARVIAPLLVQKWGEGPDPILRTQTTKSAFTVRIRDNDAFAGLILDRITLRAPLTPFTRSTTVLDAPTARRRGCYLLNCNLSSVSFSDHVVLMVTTQIDDVGIYGGSVTGGAPAGVGRPSNIALNASSFTAVLGVRISGGGMLPGTGGNIFSHHIYWTSQGSSILARWIRFGGTATDPATGALGELNFCIKGNAFGDLLDPTNGPSILRRGFVVDSCEMTGTSNIGAWGRHSGNEVAGNAYRQLVVSGNRMYYTPPITSQRLGPYFPDVYSLTLRDNTLWGHRGLSIRPSIPGYPMELAVYRNKVHGGDAGAQSLGLISISELSRVYITDNVIMKADSNASNSGVLAAQSWANVAALGSAAVIDRNQYYAPSQPDGKVFRDESPTTTMKTLAQWQAMGFDLNSTMADPGWRSPSTGDFSTTAVAITTYSLDGPKSVVMGETKTYSVVPSSPVAGVNVSLRFTNSTGQSTVQTSMLSGSGPLTFSYKAMSSGTLTITATNDGALVDPAPLAVAVMPKRRSMVPRITPTQLNRARVATRRRAGR